MRLLNTTTLELQEFFDSGVPPYVILSHRWEDGEITFKDVNKQRNLEAKGWAKVRKCCAFARADGYEWVWIDTCSIDKRSSAELSEAINSMFRWYENAEECYAYLSDVSCEESDLCTESEIESWSTRAVADTFWMSKNQDLASTQSSDLRDELATAFRASKWFTRCWTLQEFLAPRVVRFIDKDWKGVFGSKISLNKILSQQTRITNAGFRTASNMRFVSIATRMHWASRRECTRAEDVAYCLLGIFGVSMPLLYGEGAYRAFLRLQLEILKESDDESIFAWSPGVLPGSFRKEVISGLLAGSPADFTAPFLASVRPFDFKHRATRAPFSMTHKGLEIKTALLPARELDGSASQKYFGMSLKCYESSKVRIPLAIRLFCLGGSAFQRIFAIEMGDISEVPLAATPGLSRATSTETNLIADEKLIYIPQLPYREVLQTRTPPPYLEEQGTIVARLL